MPGSFSGGLSCFGLRTSGCLAGAGRGAGVETRGFGVLSSACIGCAGDCVAAGAAALGAGAETGLDAPPDGLADAIGGNDFAAPPTGRDDDNGGSDFFGVELSGSCFFISCSSAIDLPLRNSDGGTSLERGSKRKTTIECL